MKFLTASLAIEWAKEHQRHIFVEVEGVPGVLEVYPRGRAIFRASDIGKVYERYRKNLTPDEEFTDPEKRQT